MKMAQKLYNESEDYYSQLKSHDDDETRRLLGAIDKLQLYEVDADSVDDMQLKSIVDDIRNHSKSVDILQQLSC